MTMNEIMNEGWLIMNKDAWFPFWSHNQPLFEQMIAQGFSFKRNEKTAHFVDKDGNYVNFPKGYITGVGYNNNGTPHPYYASVYDGKAWWQQSKKTAQEAIDWALEIAEKIMKGVINND